MSSSINLGVSANLTIGFSPTWVPGSAQHNGLFQSSNAPLALEAPEVPTSRNEDWDLPVISIHETAESLLDTLFPYRIVNPSDGVAEAGLSAGRLLMGDLDHKKAVEALSQTLGVNLAIPGQGYVLVRLVRHDGADTHTVGDTGVLQHPHPLTPGADLGVNDAFRKDLISIRVSRGEDGTFSPDAFTESQANICLNVLSKWGTHFVSKIYFGNCIFQIYSYSSKNFIKVKNAFLKNNFTGIKFYDFIQFTTPVNGTFGYVSEYGNIMSYGNKEALQQALNAGEWHDAQWSKANSVFAPWVASSSVMPWSLLERYGDIVPFEFELTSLGLFTEIERRRVWKRVFKGIVIQKFTNSVKPYFERYCPITPSVIPAQQFPGFLSTLVTPSINTYQTGLDIAELMFADQKVARQFYISANLLHTTQPQSMLLPGTSVAILAQVAAFETEASVQVLQLNAGGYASFQLSSGRFYGGLIIDNVDNHQHYTIIDGLKYIFGTPDSYGRNTVVVQGDVRVAPPTELLAKMNDSLAFSYAFADSMLSGNPPTSSQEGGIRAFVLDTMNWLSTILPAETDNAAWLDLRVRALDAIRIAAYPRKGAYVPLLPATEYAEQMEKILSYSDAISQEIWKYQQLVQQRKEEELIVAVGDALNKNIVASGQMLSGFIQASAAQQRDLTQFYGAVIAQKKTELVQAQQKVDTLQASLGKQQLEVKNAVEAYKAAVEEWKVKQEIQFGLDVATTLFSAVTTILIPASSIKAVESLGLMAQRVQKLLNILNTSYKVFTTIDGAVNNLNNASTALSDLSEANFDVNTGAGWDELNVNMSLILDLGPTLAAKAELKAAFSILILRGKALMSAKDTANQLARDIYNQQRQQALSEAQQKRMDAIDTSLQPANLPKLDPMTLDLVGMTGNLLFIQNQMFAIMASTFILQDQALQYQTLQVATPLTSFDLLSFRSAIVRQSQNKLTALNLLKPHQPSVTTPIPVKVQVPVAQLTQGNVYSLELAMDTPAFADYMNIRVRAVMVEIQGVSGTDSGKFQFRLAYNGTPFFDRGPRRTTLIFETPSRERIYEFDAATNKPLFVDQGATWSQEVNPITPFSAWEFSFPQTTANKNIRFKEPMVQVILYFTLEARIDAGAKKTLKTRALGAENVQQAPALQDLLNQMSGKSVVNNWDVVFNMSLSKIQTILNIQYEDLKKSTSYGGKIKMESSYPVSSTTIGWKRFNLVYGYPLLTFQTTDTQTVIMNIPILSGVVQSGSKYKNNPIEWDPEVPVNEGARIEASVPIGKMEGLVNGVEGSAKNILSVVLNMAQGTFWADGLKVIGDDDKAAFSSALINYFTNNKVIFVINTLDLNKVTTLNDLRPNQFRFKTLITQTYKNQILQLFITTNNRAALDYSQANLNGCDEPIPMGADCSMMISSKLFFNAVLPQSLSQQGWKMVGVDPGESTKAWSGKFNQGNVSGNIDLSKMNNSSSTASSGAVTTTSYTYYVPGGTVSMGIDGMTLIPSVSRVRMALEKTTQQSFIQKSKTCTSTIFGTNCGSERERTLYSDYTLNMGADIPAKVTGSGREQNLGFSVSNQAVVVTGHLSGGGPCGCGDDIQAIFNQQLRDQLPSQVTTQLNVSFADVSVFALKNLLFPQNNYINFVDVNIPGDLLITGTIVDK